MFDINALSDNCILVCPSGIKTYLLKYFDENNSSFRIKFLTKADLFKGLNYTFNYDALVYLHKKYSLNYVNCEEILENLLTADCSTDKTKLLHKYYNELVDNNLIKTDSMFKNIFLNKKLYIYGYSKQDNELLSLISKITKDFEYLDDVGTKYEHQYYYFKTIEEEVLYVFNDLMSKVKNGININKIHFARYSKDYEFLVKKYIHYFKLPFILEENNFLYDSPIFKKYLMLLSNHNPSEAYERLKEIVNNDPFDAVGKIANAVNNISFIGLDSDNFFELLCYIASKTQLKMIKYDNAITFVDENDVIQDDEYVYVLGFSLGTYPKIYRDIDFYSDLEKKDIGLNLSSTLSKISEEKIVNFITHTKNLILTHKEKIGKTVFYPSLLSEKLNVKQVKAPLLFERFNVPMAQIESAIAKDNNRVYGINSEALNTYSDDEIRYMKYDHSFKGLTNYDGKKALMLSYTQVNEYYQCPFQYFLKRVLKANIFEDEFTTKLGRLFHKILEDSIKKEIKLADYDSLIKDRFKSAKDLFFLNMLLPQVINVINKNKSFAGNTMFKAIEAEKEIIVEIDEKTKFKGEIDKILIDKEDKNLSIVDYKTGDFHFEPKKLPYGIDLQLPIYSYLLSEKYNDYYNLGMYIQNVCLSKKDLNDPKLEPYTLSGLTSNNQYKIMRFDNSLGKVIDENGNIRTNSQYISGIALTKDGALTKKSKILPEDEYANLQNIALERIKNAIEQIRNGNFSISPIRFKQDRSIEFLTGQTLCDRCSCKCICFMNDSDIRLIDLNSKEE